MTLSPAALAALGHGMMLCEFELLELLFRRQCEACELGGRPWHQRKLWSLLLVLWHRRGPLLWANGERCRSDAVCRLSCTIRASPFRTSQPSSPAFGHRRKLEITGRRRSATAPRQICLWCPQMVSIGASPPVSTSPVYFGVPRPRRPVHLPGSGLPQSCSIAIATALTVLQLVR